MKTSLSDLHSSAISSVEYDTKTKVFTAVYKQGGEYTYHNVDPEEASVALYPSDGSYGRGVIRLREFLKAKESRLKEMSDRLTKLESRKHSLDEDIELLRKEIGIYQKNNR
jgi:hypothetical protein